MGKSVVVPNKCGECVVLYETCHHVGACQMSYVSDMKQYIANFFGTMFFIYASYASFAFAAKASDNVYIAGFITAFAQAASVAAIVAAMRQFNVFLNLGAFAAEFLLGNRFATIQQGIYIGVSHIVGALVGSVALYLSFPRQNLVDGAVRFATGVDDSSGLFAEFFSSFILFVLVFATKRDVDEIQSVFFSVFVGIFSAFAITGGSVNPTIRLAKNITVSIFENTTSNWDLEEDLIYLLVPIAASVAARYLVDFVLVARVESPKKKDVEMLHMGRGY